MEQEQEQSQTSASRTQAQLRIEKSQVVHLIFFSLSLSNTTQYNNNTVIPPSISMFEMFLFGRNWKKKTFS